MKAVYVERSTHGLEGRGQETDTREGTPRLPLTLVRIASTPEETLHRWEILKKAASQVIVAQGGTISHQHGVGTDHLPSLEQEKGLLGMAALSGLCRYFDPNGLMNPGKLVL